MSKDIYERIDDPAAVTYAEWAAYIPEVLEPFYDSVGTVMGWEYPKDTVEFWIYFGIMLDELVLYLEDQSAVRVIDWILLIPSIYQYVFVPFEKAFGMEDPFAKWYDMDLDDHEDLALLSFQSSWRYVNWTTSLFGISGDWIDLYEAHNWF